MVGEQGETEALASRGDEGGGALARAARWLVSPVGVLIGLPAFVLLVGAALTLLGQRALRQSNLAMGEERFRERSAFVGSAIEGSLRAADPLLDRLQELAARHDPTRPYAPVAYRLRDLMEGRPGVSFVSLSFPDGTFQGAYLDDDGVVRFQDSRFSEGRASVKRYDYAGDGELRLRREERTSYDPRTRDFYRRAERAKVRVWTPPYTFFDTHYTGVTRAAPVFDGAGGERRLRAVLTVDFDVNALSALLSERTVEGARSLLFTDDGALLAYPDGREAIRRLPLAAERPLLYSDLRDPVLTGFFTAGRPAVGAGGQSARFQVDGEAWLASVAPLDAAPELPWRVAVLVPERRFYSALRRHQLLSAVASGAALLAAALLAGMFAHQLVRLRRDTAAARESARVAVERAKELGSYRLVERIGEGGMGEVWRAEHRLLVRHAAVKLIRQQALGKPEHRRALEERFRREAQALASLRSRHTTQLFDYGVADDGTFFYVMELLDGVDLETLVAQHGPLPAARVISLALQACSSLAEAHEAGLVHRDIKPANLLVCRAADELDVVKLLDFGLVQPPEPVTARQAQEALKLTGADNYLGTPSCMAPEQALGEAIDHRADLYALGCVMWVLLTGELPFKAEEALVLMVAHVQRELPELRPLVPGWLPEELAELVVDCLAKSRDARPASAREIARRLRAIEIPPEHAWTTLRCETWWRERMPPEDTEAQASSINAIADSGRLLVRGERTPRAAPG